MKKAKYRNGTNDDGGRSAGDVPRVRRARVPQDTEAANVRYFLHALNQIALALHALGYAKEGSALMRAKVDLNNRLFNASGKMVEIAQLLH